MAAIVNLVVNIILVQFIGLAGILISTIVSVLFIYDIGYARAIFKNYFKGCGRLGEYGLQQLKNLAIALIAAGITVAVCNQIVVNSTVLKLILNACVCIVLPNGVLLLGGFKTKEFKGAVELGKRIINGKFKKRNEESKGM